MTSAEIRKKFLAFFSAKGGSASGGKGHAVVPSSSLIPDDPSVLLTTAGMQQFKKYYTGEADALKDFKGKDGKPTRDTVSVQKSFRTSDIDSVGDETHLTFFEMLGNFSFGGYFKKEAIEYAHEFITKTMGLEISYVTVFRGMQEIGVPKDEESKQIWNELGITDVREEGIEDVFWGPTGSSGPCGPTTEIYCKSAKGQDVEVWNIVFNEFFFPGSREELLRHIPIWIRLFKFFGLPFGPTRKKLEKLKAPGVDTGMGLERLAMISQKVPTIFETDLFSPFQLILIGGEEDVRSGRIIADHIRGAMFLIADGVVPSNKAAGYVLRRLIRRAMIHANKAEIKENILLLSKDILMRLINDTLDFYGKSYSELTLGRERILNVFEQEMDNFGRTLKNGLREFNHLYPGMQAEEISPGGSYHPFVVGQKVGKGAFDLYQSYGFPTEVIKELLEERFYKFDENEFQEEFKKHQEISRAGQEKKFGGHGLILDTGEIKAGSEEELKKVTRLHTATHMLQRALREVLGPDVHQAGSDITAERTRFDFSFSRKLTPEEIRKIEDLVNEKVSEDLPMQKAVLPKTEAEKTGALFFFKEKYPDPVNVYFIGKDIASAWSKEFCGGPHVTHTGEVGKFKILKEEAVGAGVRRIRAAVE